MSDEQTLRAEHDDGRDLVFVDFVANGAVVDLFDDPDEEVGFQGACVIYRTGDEWRARALTDAEREARVDRLLTQVRDRSLPREERLRDPITDTGSVSRSVGGGGGDE